MKLHVALVMFTCIASPLLGQVCSEKNVAYVDRSVSYFNTERHALDVYFPKDTATKKGVFVFLHGGSWSGGRKDTYKIFARRMAKRGFVSVLVNYRLSPSVKYDAMGEDCARALHWISQHIHRYGGDPDNITLAGHSAGGHLAAYISIGPVFERLEFQNPIRRTILIDAFGLDMVTYFQEYNNPYAQSLREVFTSDKTVWKAASPLYYVHPDINIPFLVLTGEKTFETIIQSSEKFCLQMKENGLAIDCHSVRRKKHMGMILQFFFRRKPYNTLVSFMNESLEKVGKKHKK
jgi:dipeptidyl aminopeptidase/acylaminoacyl peptidase